MLEESFGKIREVLVSPKITLPKLRNFVYAEIFLSEIFMCFPFLLAGGSVFFRLATTVNAHRAMVDPGGGSGVRPPPVSALN